MIVALIWPQGHRQIKWMGSSGPQEIGRIRTLSVAIPIHAVAEKVKGREHEIYISTTVIGKIPCKARDINIAMAEMLPCVPPARLLSKLSACGKSVRAWTYCPRIALHNIYYEACIKNATFRGVLARTKCLVVAESASLMKYFQVDFFFSAYWSNLSGRIC